MHDNIQNLDKDGSEGSMLINEQHFEKKKKLTSINNSSLCEYRATNAPIA